MGNCMLISIYLGTIGWKWTGDELQASKVFLMTPIPFYRKISFFQIYNYYMKLDRQLHAD